MTRRVLITGASIAGTTAAWWFGRAGFDVTVVERAPSRYAEKSIEMTAE